MTRSSVPAHPETNTPEQNVSRASRTTAVPVPADSPADESARLAGDWVTDVWLRFARFGWDFAGVGLLTFAAVTIIGFVSRAGQTAWDGGFLITPWVNWLAHAWGWGWPIVPAALILLGVLCLRRRYAAWPRVSLGRVLALEGMIFALLALLAILGGFSLQAVDAGADGGYIGWWLASAVNVLLPVPWSTFFVLGAAVLLGVYGSGLLSWAGHMLETWALDAPVEPAKPAAVVTRPTAETILAVPDGTILPPPLPPARSGALPPLTLLLDELSQKPDEGQIRETAEQIELRLAEFGIPANVVGYRVGPTVTQFAVEPGYVERPGPDGELVRQKVRVSQISALGRDLALALSAERLRIEAPVPGEAFVGIEVPNQRVSVVRMRPLLESTAFRKLSSALAVVLGRDVSGNAVAVDLARMPHLLIAGTTGSGKSVCIEALTTCLVMNNTPDTLRLALLDPKMVELARFNGLPHLLGKVEVELERMLAVLRWALGEMDRRYRLLEEAHARDLDTYNTRAARHNHPTLPRIVIIVDELADLMMTAPDQTEHSLIRLAQMARAVGIHLVVATQRPSTDVVTGLIKANFPARLAFTVASGIDSRVILDTGGAETLLGKGDMLFLNPESGTPLRAQGAWVTDGEIDAVIGFWKQQALPGAQPAAAPWEGMIQQADDDDNSDQLIEMATQIVRQTQRASASLLQRRLRIGYPRAARLIDELEELGVVGPGMGGGRERDVLLSPLGPDGEDDEG